MIVSKIHDDMGDERKRTLSLLSFVSSYGANNSVGIAGDLVDGTRDVSLDLSGCGLGLTLSVLALSSVGGIGAANGVTELINNRKIMGVNEKWEGGTYSFGGGTLDRVELSRGFAAEDVRKDA